MEWLLLVHLNIENLYALNFLDVKGKPQNIILVEGKLGRIRDIEIHPNNGKIYLINSDNLWRLEK